MPSLMHRRTRWGAEQRPRTQQNKIGRFIQAARFLRPKAGCCVSPKRACPSRPQRRVKAAGDQWQQITRRLSFQGGGACKRDGQLGRRFRGESHHKVDSKGRVSIPASFRRVLEAEDPSWQTGSAPELVIVYGDARREYLECYTINAIEEVDAKIDKLPRGSMRRKMLQRMYHGQSFPTSVDETYAAIKQQMRGGVLDRIERAMAHGANSPAVGWFSDETRAAMARMGG